MLGMPNKVDIGSGYFPGLNDVILFHTNSAELLVLEPRKSPIQLQFVTGSSFTEK